MNRIARLITSIFVVSTLLLAGCEKTDANEDSTPLELFTSQTANNKTDTGKRVQKVDRVEKELQPNLVVDSNVHAENTVDFNTVEVIERIINYDEAFELLMKSRSIVEEVNEPQQGTVLLNGSITDFIYKKSSTGEFLSYDGNFLNYCSEEYNEKIRPSFQGDKIDYYFNADKYSKTTDLSFMKKDEALKEVKKTLVELGLSVSENYLCYSLDYKTLDKEEQVINIKDTDDNQKHTYTVDDECYYFEFNQDIHGQSVSRIAHGDINDINFFSGTRIDVYNGLEKQDKRIANLNGVR